MTTIAIANQKGGVGKTATAVNLAAFLGLKKRTLLVDMDPQGHCAQTFALDASLLSPTIYEVLFGRAEPQEAIRAVRDKTALMPSNKLLAIGEVELRDAFRREEKLRDVLKQVDYDYIVIDCPPNYGLLSINALIAADMVLVPISSSLAYKEALTMFEVMADMKRAFSINWDVRVLQTFIRQGVKEHESLYERLREQFGDHLLSSRINLNTDISVAMASGRPVLDFPRTSGYLDYRRLADEVVNAAETQALGASKGRRSAG